MDARQWDQRYADTQLVWSVTPNQFVAAERADLPPGRAVDLAAGEGRNAIWLASRGWEVTAVDFSQVALDKGRRLAEGQELPGSASWCWPTCSCRRANAVRRRARPSRRCAPAARSCWWRTTRATWPRAPGAR